MWPRALVGVGALDLVRVKVRVRVRVRGGVLVGVGHRTLRSVVTPVPLLTNYYTTFYLLLTRTTHYCTLRSVVTPVGPAGEASRRSESALKVSK